MKMLFEFGREPEISKAEAVSLFGEPDFSREELFIVGGDSDLKMLAGRLGGTIRAAEIIAEQDHLDLTILLNNDFVQLSGIRDLGFSFIGKGIDLKNYRKEIFSFKNKAKGEGHRLRIVAGPKNALNAAQVKKNSLITKGAEIVIARVDNKIVMAKTFYMQDVDEYSKRDYGKPCRDMKVGMLPPKLAQIAVNLAAGRAGAAQLYDPFCGSGTIIQEGVLMGHSVNGSDIDPKMVECAHTNLEWLAKNYHISSKPTVTLWDASKPNDKLKHLDAFVTESTLGPVRSSLPAAAERKVIFDDLLSIHRGFLSWAGRSLKAGGKIVLMLPVYGDDYPEDILDLAAGFGYSHQRFSGNDFLLYRRPDQITGRAVVVLRKDQSGNN